MTPLAAAPLAPPGFRATSGDGSAILYWGAADDNGSPITKYQYQQDGGAWTDIPDSDANTVEYTVTGLTNGAVCAFKLLAVNSIGAGAETDAVTATPLPPPGAPSGLTATANPLVLQRQFREGCGVMPAWRRGAWHGSVGPVRYCPAYPVATAATLQVRTVPGAAFPAPPGRPAAS